MLLQEKLQWLIGEYSIAQIFYRQEKKSAKSHLVVIVSQSADVKTLRSKKWVTEIRDKYQFYVYFIDCSTLEYQLGKGHPFLECHCHQPSMIYQKEDSPSLFLINRNWKKYHKKFDRYEDSFHHDHEIHRVQLERLISEDAYNSVFTSFEELINYDLEFLEELYTGNRTYEMDLNQRINNLVMYLPELRSHFVRKNNSEFFIAELFAKARNAISDDDIIYDTEMFEALRVIQESLFEMINARFYELKHLIKKQYKKSEKFEQQKVSVEEGFKDVILEKATEKILSFLQPEQMYLFSQATYGETTTYYLLLIGHKMSNEKIESVTQSLKSVFGKTHTFMLLGHDRYWIQKDLYQHQAFFADSMQAKNLIYTSDRHHPDLHWQVPYTPHHDDLYFYYKTTLEGALQFNKLVCDETGNWQGVASMFSLFFLSFCRTYIFVKTYYLPNYLNSETLWNLCVLADSHIQKYSYLIEQLCTNPFSFTDYHRSVHHQVIKLDQDKVAQMKSLVDGLMYELKQEVIDGNLLDQNEMKRLPHSL